ncbi:MAG: NAD(P)/FAD-dependent oxidoreductase [Candidatus Thermoplasmatota archaeon]
MAQDKKVSIIGAGPAGISAGIYLKRVGLDPVIIEKEHIGGLIRNASLVENYPGFPKGIKGLELAELFKNQLERVDVSVIKTNVDHIDYRKGSFIVKTNNDTIISRVVIVASGTKPKKTRFNGCSSLLEGKYLFYEPYSIPIKKRGCRVAIVGGGDIAFDYALTLLDNNCCIDILCRSQPRCIPILKSRVENRDVNIHCNCNIHRVGVLHDNVIVDYTKNGKRCTSQTDYILVACGREPDINFLSDSLKKAYESCTNIPITSVPGLYFVGDVIRGSYRQVGISVGDGIHAAMLADEFIRGGA